MLLHDCDLRYLRYDTAKCHVACGLNFALLALKYLLLND